jgi:4a-hydroxytetrahydrobiopterin dehydratase
VTEPTRTEIQAAAQPFTWRYLQGKVEAVYPVASLGEAVRLAAVAAESSSLRGRLHLDLRADRVRCAVGVGTGVDGNDLAEMAAVATAIRDAGWTPAPAISARYARPTMGMELTIDATDPEALMGFWMAALGYVREDWFLVDPAGQYPVVGFQMMDPARTERNRIHVEVLVAHDEAEARIAAVLAAGGTVGATSQPPCWTVLIDAEGNEVCICSWEGRDERGW